MQSAREAMMAIFSGKGQAERIPGHRCGHYKPMVFPGERYIKFPFDPYGTGPDSWNVLWTNLGPNPAIDGSMVAAGFKLFDDFADWKQKVMFPDPSKLPLEQIFGAMEKNMQIDRTQDVVEVLLLSGQFERLNEMIGMEDALCAFFDEPELMHEWMDAMCEYKLKCIELAAEYAKPDIIDLQDDWGAAKNMFFSPEIWREFIKPNEKKYADRIHELGMLYRHHSCGYIMQIIPDLVEIGVDILEPVMVCNDVEWILDNYGKQICVAGGVDNQRIERPDASEEDIIAEAHRCIDTYAKRGRYIPDFVATKAEVSRLFSTEVDRYGVAAFQ